MESISTKQNLQINATRLFPEVSFKADGTLSIKGRIISDHLCEFFTPLFNWVEECSCSRILLNIELDYLNSNGTFLLLELLKRMESKSDIESIVVVWQYEEEDEEHFDLGEIIRAKLSRTQFKYVTYA